MFTKTNIPNEILFVLSKGCMLKLIILLLA